MITVASGFAQGTYPTTASGEIMRRKQQQLEIRTHLRESVHFLLERETKQYRPALIEPDWSQTIDYPAWSALMKDESA